MQQFLTQLFELVLFPLIIALGIYLVNFIQAKADELKQKTSNELEQKYIGRIAEVITSCVLTTNQTYVESLKKKGEFGIEAQKEAFNLTKAAVLNMLSDELKQFIAMAFGDVNIYLTNQIEATVNYNKANS